MELSTVIAFAIGLLLLYVVGILLVIPIKVIIKLIINGLIGGVTLFLFNLIGAYFGLHIPINAFSALIVGILGLPGVILLIIGQIIL